MRNEPVDSFRPKPSLGWLWVLSLTLLVTVPLPIAFTVDPPKPDEVLIVWVSMIPLFGLVVWFLAVVVLFPRMRYDLGVEALHISYGPLLRYTVPYASISGIEIQHLRFSPWSSFRFPGLALWKVAYTGQGQIRMCSTRSHRGVLVITAGKHRYGISPAEEDRFVHGLKAAVERASLGATADTAPRSP
jgi:hypothetical protein